MCKTIKHKVKFKAEPKDVYQFLAQSQKVGKKFSAQAGRITGMVVDLKPGVRIVQAWRNSKFPSGIFSMASFNLSRTKNGGTELILIHRGVPKELIPGVEEEWRTLYWEKMKRTL